MVVTGEDLDLNIPETVGVSYQDRACTEPSSYRDWLGGYRSGLPMGIILCGGEWNLKPNTYDTRTHMWTI